MASQISHIQSFLPDDALVSIKKPIGKRKHDHANAVGYATLIISLLSGVREVNPGQDPASKEPVDDQAAPEWSDGQEEQCADRQTTEGRPAARTVVRYQLPDLVS